MSENNQDQWPVCPFPVKADAIYPDMEQLRKEAILSLGVPKEVFEGAEYARFDPAPMFMWQMFGVPVRRPEIGTKVGYSWEQSER